MKKLSILALCLLFSLSLCAQETGSAPHVLFVGNSYTSSNNLPQMFRQIANSAADSVTVASHAPGGATFQNHLSNNSLQLIAQGGWDYVILQEQSQLPSFPIGQVQTDCFPYAARLVDSIRSNNPTAMPVFYMTWGRENGDQDNCAHFPPLCTYEGMDDLLRERYTMMANDNETDLAPVGAVWRYIRTNHPEINLYVADGSHPSMAGTYTAACTFYSILFKKSLSSENDDVNLPVTIKQIIKNAVDRVVCDSLSQWIWEFEEPSGLPFYRQSSDYQVKFYPNPANNFITVELNSDVSQKCFISIFNENGQMVWKNDITLYKKGELDISSLLPGIYILRISNENRPIFYGKLIKKG